MKFIKSIALLYTLFITPGLAAISLSSLDNFSSSSEGWQIGGAGAQPSRVASAGPDSQTGFLSHFSDGSSANGKWLMWTTETEWQGNYTAAGATGIGLWANVSSGASPVNMRVAFDGPGGWFYSTAQSVSSGWNSYTFFLNSSNFTYATGSGGTAVFSDTMSGVTRFEILAGSGSVTYRSSGDLVQAGPSTATILLDDIAVVPEPSTGALLVTLGMVAYGYRRRMHHARQV